MPGPISIGKGGACPSEPFSSGSFAVRAPSLARENNSPAQRSDVRIYLDAVVTPKSGPPVSALQQQDFTILDNDVPQTITSFNGNDVRQGAT